jgi:hypothetical protein
MAIATGTAMLISAGVGLASTGISAGLSFGQAKKQRRKQMEAEAAAKEKMNKARKKLEVNFADALSVQKEPYERQREALLSAGSQALEAGVESERGGAATAGRVLAAQNEGQGKVRDAMNADMQQIEQFKVEEDSRLRDIGVQLDLSEVEGAQKAAAVAEQKANIANQQGAQGVLNFVKQGVAMLPQDFSGVKTVTPENNTVPPVGSTIMSTGVTLNPALQTGLNLQAPNLFGNQPTVGFNGLQQQQPQTPFQLDPNLYPNLYNLQQQGIYGTPNPFNIN